MIYVVGQIWIWLLVAIALGAALAWLILRFGASNRSEEQLGPWRDRVSSLEHERDSLRRDLGEARDRATESEARLSALRDDLADRDARIEGLARDLDSLKSEATARGQSSGNGADTAPEAAVPAAAKPPTAAAKKPAAAGAKKPVSAAAEKRTAAVADKPAAAASGDTPDKLSRVKGIGSVLEAQLNALGITSLAQLAALSDKEVDRIDEAIGFKGRIRREDWVGQARKLLPDG